MVWRKVFKVRLDYLNAVGSIIVSETEDTGTGMHLEKSLILFLAWSVDPVQNFTGSKTFCGGGHRIVTG